MTDNVAEVRSFTRLVTQRVGVLEEEYLARGRPLGASRVLWEIGDDGVDLRELRARLGLDSGYLSRLLRRLADEGLVTVAVDAGDRRVRVARLTAAGRAERTTLDGLSDAVARSLLEPLSEAERRTMVAAMVTVQRMLTLGLVRIEVADPHSDDAHAAAARYGDELGERFDGGFDPALTDPVPDELLAPPHGILLIARRQGRVVGCGAFRRLDDETVLIRRMWVAGDARGLGLGRRILRELEARAVVTGARRARLETNRALVEAVGLYRDSGYREVAPFSGERYAHHWFEKALDGQPTAGGATDGAGDATT
jgi:DNA-binding MarR family transcriptional regulator/GNAT superfamily N-acetyltransferase